MILDWLNFTSVCLWCRLFTVCVSMFVLRHTAYWLNLSAAMLVMQNGLNPRHEIALTCSILCLQQHIEALPDLDLLEAYWQHVNSVLPHEKRDSQKLIADMQILQRVHFADLLQGTPITRSPLEVARAVARQTLRQVPGCQSFSSLPSVVFLLDNTLLTRSLACSCTYLTMQADAQLSQ